MQIYTGWERRQKKLFNFASITNSKSSGIFSPYFPKTRGEKRVLILLLAISGITLVLIGIFYLLNPRSVVGAALVNTPAGTPEEFPSPSSFPFYVKPVTIFFVAAVAFSYCFFSLLGNTIQAKVPRWLQTLFLIVSIVVFAGGVYEVLFNFTLWGSILVSNPNPDASVNKYPLSSWQTNLVFATKSYLALVFIAYFALATFRHTLEQERA